MGHRGAALGWRQAQSSLVALALQHNLNYCRSVQGCFSTEILSAVYMIVESGCFGWWQ